MIKMNKKGFTIVELVIVIAVIAILAAVLIPTFTSLVGKAEENAAMQEATNTYKALLLEDEVTTATGEKIEINGSIADFADDVYDEVKKETVYGIDAYIVSDDYVYSVTNGTLALIEDENVTEDTIKADTDYVALSGNYASVYLYNAEA